MHACNLARKKREKREYLDNQLTRALMKAWDMFFVSSVEIPRIKVGKRQTIDTLINEEALLLAKYLRNEKKKWNPRIANIN